MALRKSKKSGRRKRLIPNRASRLAEMVLKSLNEGEAEEGLRRLVDSRLLEDIPPSLFHLVRGVDRMVKLDLLGAVSEFEIGLRDTDLSDLRIERYLKTNTALAKMGMMVFGEAMSALKDLELLDPLDPNPPYLLAHVLSIQGNHKGALKYALRGRQLAERFVILGKELQTADKHSIRASGDLVQNIFSGMTLPSFDCLLGDLYANLDQPDQAMSHYITVLDHVDSINAEVLLSTAKGFVALGDFKRAIAVAGILHSKQPESGYSNAIRALVKLELSDQGAIQDIDTSLIDNPLQLGLTLDKIRILISNENHAGAMKILNRLLVMSPKDPYVLFLRGSLCNDAGDLRGALNDFEAARDRLEGLSLPHFGLAITFSSLMRAKEAESCLERGLSLDGDSWFAYFARGKVAFNLKKGGWGIEDFKISVGKAPSEAEVWYSLGIANYSAGRHEEALSSLSQAGRLGHPKAFATIRTIRSPEKGWRSGETHSKTAWRASLKDAATEVLSNYESDQKLPVSQRLFANLKDAAYRFYDNHRFPKYPRLTKKQFCSGVYKVGQRAKPVDNGGHKFLNTG